MAAAIAEPTTLPPLLAAPPRTPMGRALRKLAARRAALTAHNPRQIAVPLVGPALAVARPPAPSGPSRRRLLRHGLSVRSGATDVAPFYHAKNSPRYATCP